MPLSRPPNGTPIDKKDFPCDDTVIMRNLRSHSRCQQRLLTDRGQHIIFCGGYYLGPTTKTRKGLRCRYHR